jgi:hypothetical protein
LCELISRATAAIEGRFRHIVSASPREMKRNDTIHPGKSAKAAELSGAQDQKRTNDQIATGVAIVVFWPATFIVGGDGQVAAQFRLAERRRTSQHPKCGIPPRQIRELVYAQAERQLQPATSSYDRD